MTDDRLKLVAMDAEDLGILSAHCQDAVMKLGDLAYLPAESRFLIEMNRFVWEKRKGAEEPERRRAVLHFERVGKVSVKDIDPKQKDRILSLLAIVYEPVDAPAGTIDLVFAGSGVIRLHVECVEAQLADMKTAWAASSIPVHPDA